MQPNDVGTDEFMTLCRLLGVEPYITVNAGFGDACSAARVRRIRERRRHHALGRQRAANGHPEPYRVKFWGIGNEMWGDCQFGDMPLASTRSSTTCSPRRCARSTRRSC